MSGEETLLKLDSVQNHRGFTIQPNDANLTSRFHPTDPTITIKTDLLDAPGTTGGNIQFRDPWYIDSLDAAHGNNPMNRGMQNAVFRTRESTAPDGFKPNFDTPFPPLNHPYRGVFLNQDYNIPGQPYYSVGAPQVNIFTINNQNYTGYFLNWTGNASEVTYRTPEKDTTAVVFKTSGATATAKYKGHLASSVATATASPSQRKLVAHGGIVHMVYESAGEIWYTFSVNNGETWEREYRLSDGAGGYSAPSIAAGLGPDLPERYVVYRRLIDNMYEIVARIQEGDDWTDPHTISTPASIPEAVNPRPVIGRTAGDHLVALWSSAQGLTYNEATRIGNEWVWSSQSVWAADPAIANPSLSNTPASGEVYFSFELNGQVYADPWPGQTFVPISDDPTYINNRNASVGIDAAGRVHVAWVAFDRSRGMDVVLHRGYIGGEGWSPYTVILDDLGELFNLHASVCAHADPFDGGVSVFWGDGSIPFVFDHFAWDGYKFDGWKYTQFPGQCDYTNAGAATDPAKAAFVVAQTDQTLYPVRFGLHDDSYGSWSSPLVATGNRNAKLYRRAVFTDTTTGALLAMEFGDIVLRGERDTLTEQLRFVATRTNLRGTFLRTETFRINEASIASLRIALEANRLSGDGVVTLVVVDSATGSVVGTLSSTALPRTKRTVLKKAISEVLPATGRPVCLELRVQGISLTRFKPSFANIEAIRRESGMQSATILSKAAASLSTPKLPEKYELHASFPNPFNPTTTMNFDLPEPSRVSLVVYDVLGRKVAELVNGVQDAGFRSVSWDASGVASGMYFARFTATDGNGNVKLAKVSKLLLAK